MVRLTMRIIASLFVSCTSIQLLNQEKQKCDSWCPYHSSSWKTKCAWTSKTCNGCADCVNASSVPAFRLICQQNKNFRSGDFPEDLAVHNGLKSQAQCASRCQRHKECNALVFNKYGDCYLKAKVTTVEDDDPVHETVSCKKEQSSRTEQSPSTEQPPPEVHDDPVQNNPPSTQAVWRVSFPSGAGVNVRAEPDLTSEALAQKVNGEIVRGSEHDGWLKLVDEPGYIIMKLETGEPLLEKLEDPA